MTVHTPMKTLPVAFATAPGVPAASMPRLYLA